MTEFLTTTEIHQLTGYARHGSQASWLAQHAIPHRVDGRRIIVSRSHVKAWLEGKITPFSAGPNWASVK